jgi:plastocyanin
MLATPAEAPVTAHAAATTTIKLVDNKFRPSRKTVARGTTLRFLWTGKNPHNVFVVSGPVQFHSGTKTKGSYRKRVTRKGSYALVCTIHSGMTLRLKVR